MKVRWICLMILTPLLTGCVWIHAENIGKQSHDFTRESISTSGGAAPIAPYSQAIKVGDMLWVSGQIPINPETGQLVTGDIRDQVHQVMKNIGAILEAAGFTYNDIVQTQVFLADLNDYAGLNEAYGSYFTVDPPARAALQVARIPRDAGVEIMVTAVKTD